MKIYQQNELNELVKILKNEGVICVPTDTVYGLCARMNSKVAHDNLIKIKNRPTNKLFPIMCADEEQIKSVAIVDNKVEKLIKAFMPGPITLILKKKKEVPEYVNNGGETLAVRMATSKIIRNLIIQTGCPVFMSSANLSGEPTCTTLEEVKNKCPNIDGILEGTIEYGRPSTIIDCTCKNIKILRNGPITTENIEKVLNKKIAH